jgi:hypothetical protein
MTSNVMPALCKLRLKGLIGLACACVCDHGHQIYTLLSSIAITKRIEIDTT